MLKVLIESLSVAVDLKGLLQHLWQSLSGLWGASGVFPVLFPVGLPEHPRGNASMSAHQWAATPQLRSAVDWMDADIEIDFLF